MPISLTSPQAAVAAAPYLIGFTPVDSLVLLLCDDDGLRVSMRVDLPPHPDVDWLVTVLDGLGDPLPGAALMIVYADTVPEDVASGLAQWVTCAIGPVLQVLDCVLVHDERVHSLVGNLPVEGVSLDSVGNHPVVAELVAAGMTHLESREDLETQLDPVADEVSVAVAQLLQSVEPEPYEQWRDRSEAEVCQVLTSAEPLTPEDLVLIGRACHDVFVRDPLLAVLMEEQPEHAFLHHVRDRLTYAAVHLPDDYAGGVAATVALLCWALGDWASAYIAADRAEAVDPENTLAPLVVEALDHGLPADTWRTLTRDIPLEVLRGRRRRTA